MLLRFKESEEDEVVRKTTLREAGFCCFGNIISSIIMNVVIIDMITVGILIIIMFILVIPMSGMTI